MDKCKNCGHECHCIEGNCYECANDVCTDCKCDSEKDIPDSFRKENT